MSPLTEKLNALLDDRDKLSANLAEWRKHCAAQDETITALQQQTAKQASEIWALRNQNTHLATQLSEAMLNAADPEDAKLKTRIESLYTELVPAGSSSSSSSTSSSSNGNGNGNGNAKLVSSSAGGSDVTVTVSQPARSTTNSARAASPSASRQAAVQTVAAAQGSTYKFAD